MLGPGEEPPPFQSEFSHTVQEYAAGFYGYLWSLIFAQDVFARFIVDGRLNLRAGREFRSKVLEPGAGRDEGELLRDFLGRDPDEQAFFRDIEEGTVSLGLGGRDF